MRTHKCPLSGTVISTCRNDVCMTLTQCQWRSGMTSSSSVLTSPLSRSSGDRGSDAVEDNQQAVGHAPQMAYLIAFGEELILEEADLRLLEASSQDHDIALDLRCM